jgi:hypothetical protein
MFYLKGCGNKVKSQQTGTGESIIPERAEQLFVLLYFHIIFPEGN